MRKLAASFFISLDGVVEGPGPEDSFELAGWTMPYWDDAIGAYVGGGMAAVDTLLMGRVTYEGFASAFANGTDDVAAIMNGFKKYVVSTTLKHADWANTTLISSNVNEEVARLKEQPGKDIGMSGSGTLVQSLLRANLIDELNLAVYPVVLGRGKKLFEDGMQETLKLAHSQTSPSGVLLLTYQVVRDA